MTSCFAVKDVIINISVFITQTCVFGSSVTTETLERDPHTTSYFENAEKPRMEEIFDVLILGAGLAGLGAARELRKSGKSVCVLEAQQQPGGRVRTVQMVGGSTAAKVEAGAQWIHGKENALYEIAAENGLISEELGEEARGNFIRNDGKVFDQYLVKRVDYKVGQILEECEEFVKCPLDKDRSIREYLEEKFGEFLAANPDIDPVEGRQLLDWHIRFQVIDNSCRDLFDVGVNEWGRYSFNGESCQAHINVKNGFDQILDVIVQDIGEGRVLCNQDVLQVMWGKEISTVRCRNGNVFKGKFVIVTFPIGILKQSKLFTPALPDHVQSTIDSMGYGTIDKIYLKFDEPFWDPDFEGVQFLWSDNCPSIANWIKSMSGFDLIGGNTLLGWIGGAGANEMETLADQEIVADCTRLLGQLLGKTVPKPSHYYCTRWSSNVFAGGSYCFNELRDKNSSRTSIHAPVTASSDSSYPLFFAGEACHESYFSTAHGAFESGIEQAKQVLLRLVK